jgi:hypothetical protein
VAGLRSGEQIVALDVGPGGILHGLGVVRSGGDSARLYRIDPASGIATAAGAAFAVPTTSASAAYGIDFDPSTGVLRVVNGAGESLRVDPDDGSPAADDPNLNPGSPNVAAIAYGSAGLRGLGHAASALLDIDPADGVVDQLGALGFVSASAEALNLDIAPSGAAYATALPSGGAASLYEIDLTTGALVPLGPTPAVLRAFAVLPETTVRFGATAYVAAEGGTATIAVLRTGPASGSARVAYATAGGSASSDDVAPAAGTLTFAPGQASATFEIPIQDDALDEDDETLALELRDPAAPLALGAPAVATLTIADDELAAPRPDVRLGPLPRTMRLRALLRRGLRVTATPNVAVRLTFSLLGRARKAQLSARENLALVTHTRGLSALPRSVRLKPRRALVGRPRQDFRVRVQVIATDALGRARVVNRVVRIRVPALAR